MYFLNTFLNVFVDTGCLLFRKTLALPSSVDVYSKQLVQGATPTENVLSRSVTSIWRRNGIQLPLKCLRNWANKQ